MYLERNKRDNASTYPTLPCETDNLTQRRFYNRSRRVFACVCACVYARTLVDECLNSTDRRTRETLAPFSIPKFLKV